MHCQTILNKFKKMRKGFGIIMVLAIIICMASCKMKECKCYSTNVLTQNDSIVQTATDTVNDFTRGECEDFNEEESLTMDSNTVIHHTIFCSEN